MNAALRYYSSVAILMLASPSLAGIVYDNTTATFGAALGSNGAPQTVGDLVTLGGTDRTVTQVDFRARGTDCCVLPAVPFEADFSLHFYNVGPGNAVGSELAPVVSLSNVSVPASEFTLSFTGLNVAVPNSFIVAFSTDSITSTSNGSVVSANAYASPSVGSSDDDFAYLSRTIGLPTSTSPFTGLSPSGNIGLRITAIPEPSAFVFLSVIGFVGGGLRTIRKRHRRA